MYISTGVVIEAKLSKNYAKVKLDNTNQVVIAHYSNGMIQIGSKVTLISDDFNHFLISTYQNGMDEVINILIDLASELITALDNTANLKAIDKDKDPKGKGFWEHTKKSAISTNKSNIENIKSRLEKFKLV
jgi:hypothetical protein